ncbi:MAG TPA: nickel-responsive transcriptional regulator NikR [Methanosarcinales archaeon]|nr:nickel-responsive transcriptional regulator NikR [Methanosarcinales archaeon]
MRIGVSLPDNLLTKFDDILAKRGYSSRSEGIRDAIRSYIRYYEWTSEVKGGRVGVISLTYNHNQRGLVDALADIQHKHLDVIRSSLHMHVDEEMCLEVVVLQGDVSEVRDVAEGLMALKGVQHLKLTTVSTEK